MRVFGDHGEDDAESRFDRECYRCDRTVAPPFLFTIRVEPPAPLSEKYADSVRYCCEHCAAAMNLSDFSQREKMHAGRGDEQTDG